MNVVEQLSLGVRYPTAFLAETMVSNQHFVVIFLQSEVYEDDPYCFISLIAGYIIRVFLSLPMLVV